jgi:hypothetical protein
MINESVGFTGTKLGITSKQDQQVYNLLLTLRSNHSRFHHGDCKGADVSAAAIAHLLKYRIVCHPPINPRHRGWFEHNDDIHIPYEYIVRDRHIVNVSQVLIATPHTPYEIIRSGTWTTVRYARSLGRTIYIIKPDGTVQIEEFVQKRTTGV